MLRYGIQIFARKNATQFGVVKNSIGQKKKSIGQETILLVK